MDDDVITWNLRGPKRMKKRKELNALIKNNVKYKSLPKKNSADAFNMSSGIGTSASGRLLNNYSSSDEQEYFFTANKTTIRQRRKKYYCKLFKMIVFGFIMSVSLLIGITLLFSYSKFQYILNDLKKEVDVQNSNTQTNFKDLKLKMDEHENLLKKLKDKIAAVESESVKNFNKDSKREKKSILDELKNNHYVNNKYSQNDKKHFPSLRKQLFEKNVRKIVEHN